jgi:hypothetical protein
MVYGEEKARDMTRSLLPSRHRASARSARATIHRSARRQSRVEMAQLARDLEAFEDLAGLDDDVTGEIRHMVCGRRQGDKVAPFIRWARAITRPLPQHSRLSHLRGFLPQGVIGDHALFHLSDEKDFAHPDETARREALWRKWAEDSTPWWLDRGEQAELLRALLRSHGGHRAFNRWLQTPFTLHYRPLLGEHDVLPFLADLWERPREVPDARYSSRHGRGSSPLGPYSLQASPVNKFLRMFKKLRGDVDATVKALELETRAYWVSVLGRPSPLRRPSP